MLYNSPQLLFYVILLHVLYILILKSNCTVTFAVLIAINLMPLSKAVFEVTRLN